MYSKTCDVDITELNPSSFTLTVLSDRYKIMNMSIQSVQLPGMTATAIPVPNMRGTPFFEVGTLTFTPMIVTFFPFQNLKNYGEFVDWMRRNSAPNDFGEYDLHRPDARITVIDKATNRGVMNIIAERLLPTTITELNFTVSQTDVTPSPVSVTLTVDRVRFESIP